MEPKLIAFTILVAFFSGVVIGMFIGSYAAHRIWKRFVKRRYERKS